MITAPWLSSPLIHPASLRASAVRTSVPTPPAAAAPALQAPAEHRTTTSEPSLAKIYYIAWKLRPHHAWRSEEYTVRGAAYERYFNLIERGYEALLEVRSRSQYFPGSDDDSEQFYGETT